MEHRNAEENAVKYATGASVWINDLLTSLLKSFEQSNISLVMKGEF